MVLSLMFECADKPLGATPCNPTKTTVFACHWLRAEVRWTKLSIDAGMHIEAMQEAESAPHHCGSSGNSKKLIYTSFSSGNYQLMVSVMMIQVVSR